jgi:hypothetical protein
MRKRFENPVVSRKSAITVHGLAKQKTALRKPPTQLQAMHIPLASEEG